MNALVIISVLILLTGCNSFDRKVLDDPKYASGHIFGTNTKICPRSFQFDNYIFVTGFPNDSGSASFGLYKGRREIYFETSSDGVYDTVLQANLNKDGVRDFIVVYEFEDGASVFGLLSKSNATFSRKEIVDHLNDSRCDVYSDTSGKTHPLIVKDVDNDGIDEIITNSLHGQNGMVAISCTDTVFINNIK